MSRVTADDIFGIDEVTFYDGEWKDSNYAVSGEVLDAVSYFITILAKMEIIPEFFTENIKNYSGILPLNPKKESLNGSVDIIASANESCDFQIKMFMPF